MKKLRENQYLDSGFTLIETIVTLFIFSILITVVLSAFVSALNLQRRAFNIQQVEENGNFILESMAKEIRVSTVNTLDACPAASLSISHPINGTIVYSLSGTDLIRTVNGNQYTVNSNVVQFSRLQFCISGNANPDQRQPRVTLVASIRSTQTKQQATVDVQTTLSQRRLQE